MLQLAARISGGLFGGETEAMTGARVIVVEDEPLTRNAYIEALRADGNDVRGAADPPACRAALSAAPADIVVLDLGLPGVTDQLGFAKELCQPGLDVLIVTVRDTVATRIAALDLGAEDFLVKPVDLGELAARVRRLHRRRLQSRGRRYRVGTWVIDFDRRTLECANAGAAADVTRGEFELLACLVEADGKIVTRERLSEVVGRGGTDRRSVDALVSRLRRKLSNDEAGADLIVTSPGFGYRIGVAATRLG